MIIGHLDADCFYVSAERVRHRALRHIPVGVIGNQGACVIAKSYEMKAAGVKTGTPIWDAVKLCPDGIYIPRDFRWYEVISRLMLAAVQHNSQRVEYYSIDEFFFDASLLPMAFGCPMLEAARSLQQHILRQIGVPVSIGVSRTRSLAKLASDAEKPFGCSVMLTDDEIANYVESIDIGEVTGIGDRSRAKLQLYGIHTVGDFRRATPKLINRLLTKKGEGIWWELHGQPITPIATRRPMHKHVTRGGSIGGTTQDPDKLNAWVVRNVERLVEALFSNRYVCNKLGMILSHKERRDTFCEVSLPQATGDFENLIPAAKHLFKQCRVPGWRITHLDLIAGELAPCSSVQKSLFDVSVSRLDAIKRAVNDKLGRWAVRSGETLPLTEIYEDEAHYYDICDIHGKSCF